MQTVYSAQQALCKQYTQCYGHCAKSIFSRTGIMQTVYSAPQALNIILCATGKTAFHPTGVIHYKNIFACYPKRATGYCHSNWRCHEIKRKNYYIEKNMLKLHYSTLMIINYITVNITVKLVYITVIYMKTRNENVLQNTRSVLRYCNRKCSPKRREN